MFDYVIEYKKTKLFRPTLGLTAIQQYMEVKLTFLEKYTILSLRCKVALITMWLTPIVFTLNSWSVPFDILHSINTEHQLIYFVSSWALLCSKYFKNSFFSCAVSLVSSAFIGGAFLWKCIMAANRFQIVNSGHNTSVK